jgi:hypothetical protein
MDVLGLLPTPLLLFEAGGDPRLQVVDGVAAHTQFDQMKWHGP